jgi:hypothetical protein
VAIAIGRPGRDLVRQGDPIRPGLGRLSRRGELAALILVVVYGGLANAAGMVGPVLRVQDRIQDLLKLRSPHLVIAAYDLLALVVLPLVLHGSATELARRLGPISAPRREIAIRFAYALVPLGFAVWLAHAGFHLFTSAATIVPAAQRFAEDLGSPMLGTPDWTVACCRSAAGWILRFEIVVLQIGMLLSLHSALRIALFMTPRPGSPLKALAPWAALIVLLYAVSLWVVFQPMQMRGTLPGAG